MSDSVHAASPWRALATFNRDHYGGALLILLGAGAAAKGYAYGVGTLSNMGSGFFPVALGALLALLGIMILPGANRRRADAADSAAQPSTVVDWRGWFCIVAGLGSFVVIGRHGGLVPATFATVFVSALGDRQNTWRSALALSASMVVIGVIVFWWALQLQLPLFQWG